MKRTVTYEFERGDMIVTSLNGNAWVGIRVAPGNKGVGLQENNEWRGSDGSFWSDDIVSERLERGTIKYIGNIKEFQNV